MNILPLNSFPAIPSNERFGSGGLYAGGANFNNQTTTLIGIQGKATGWPDLLQLTLQLEEYLRSCSMKYEGVASG
jgi:hypothetical protein